MRDRYKTYGPGAYFVTSSTIEWEKYPDEEFYYHTILKELEFRRKTDNISIYGFVIMPDHFHFAGLFDDPISTMRTLKSYTGRKLLENARENGYYDRNKFWQNGFHPIHLYDEEILKQKLNYMHDNPVEAGLCSSISEWKYSSARNYYGGEIVFEIDPF